MIAFGVAISDQATYEEVALPGIERAAEPGSPILTRAGLPIHDAYNEIIDEAAEAPDLEALALLHQDLELTDDSLPRRARRLLGGDSRIGLIGALGARDVTLHLWLASRRLYGTVAAPGLQRRFSSGSHEVEGVDGALLVLAPWAARGLRFGKPPAGGFHGYDVDISARVRAHGGKVVCDDIPYFHHRSAKADHDAQRLAGIALARSWDPALRPREWAPAFQL
jgi:Glycosyltransferase like family